MAQPAWVQMREKARIPRGAIAACSGSRSSAPRQPQHHHRRAELALVGALGERGRERARLERVGGDGRTFVVHEAHAVLPRKVVELPLLEGAERPSGTISAPPRAAPAAPAAPASSLRREMPPTAVSTACSTSTSAASSAAGPLLHDLLGRVEAEARHDQRPGHAQEREPQGEPEELGVVGDDVDDDRRDARRRRQAQERCRGELARSRLTSRAPRAGGTRSAGPRAR